MQFDDPLADIDDESAAIAQSKGEDDSAQDQGNDDGTPQQEEVVESPDEDSFAPPPPSGEKRSYAEELHSRKISARFRTFFIDLKQSKNGKFVKISEKSRGGQKSTIMMDAEDVPEFITALQDIQNQL